MNPNLTLSEYESFVLEMWGETGPDCRNIMFLGIGGEAGEVQEIYKKFLRPKNKAKMKVMNRDHLQEELGDVLYYLTRIALEYDFTLRDIMGLNVAKLRERYAKDGDQK